VQIGWRDPVNSLTRSHRPLAPDRRNVRPSAIAMTPVISVVNGAVTKRPKTGDLSDGIGCHQNDSQMPSSSWRSATAFPHNTQICDIRSDPALGPVRKLSLQGEGFWVDRIIPLAVKGMAGQVHGFELGFGDLVGPGVRAASRARSIARWFRHCDQG
jgi:hypothetical protein